MRHFGWGASVSCARARYRMPLLAAFCLAHAAPLSAAQRKPKADSASVVEARRLALARDPQAKPRVLALIRAESAESDRARLADAFGLLPRKPSEAAELDELLSDPSAQVRLSAVTALGRLGGPEAETRLRTALAGDVSAGVRLNAAFWLGQHKTAASIAALGDALAKDSDANVRVNSAQSLSRMSSSAAGRALRRGADDSDERVRRWAK